MKRIIHAIERAFSRGGARRRGRAAALLIVALAVLVVVGAVAWLGVWLDVWPGLGPGEPSLDEIAPAGGVTDRAAVIEGTGVERLEEDARREGWVSEAFSDVVLARLHTIGELLEGERPITAAGLEGVASPDCAVEPLTPETLEEVFDDGVFRVRRGVPGVPGEGRLERGPDGLARALESLRGALAGERRTKFKVFRVDLPPDGGGAARSLAYFQLAGSIAAGRFQASATWRIDWTPDPADPAIVALTVEAHEDTLVRSGDRHPFTDCTDAVLSSSDVFKRQLRPGVDLWTGVVDVSFGIDIGGWQGITIGDVNGDGLDDLYACQPGGLPNRLFVQRPDGTAVEVSERSGVDWIDSTHGALLVDLDNDGDQDFLVGVRSGVLVLENDGEGRFRVAAAELLPAAIPYSLAAADYDEDGDLDVYVCCYDRRRGINRHVLFARPVPYHDANNGGRNALLRNDGGWRFTHVTRRVGLDENNRRFSYAASWEDYDNDGDLDLYVANDFGRNNLYRNDGGRFRDVAGEAGVEDISPGMSVAWGDYDNDGRMDLYVSNMFSSAGNRITFQERFQSGSSESTRSQLQRHARGNSLFRNLDERRFADVSVEAGVTIGRWAWGSLFADLNNDGREDIVVTNGFITQEDTGDL